MGKKLTEKQRIKKKMANSVEVWRKFGEHMDRVAVQYLNQQIEDGIATTELLKKLNCMDGVIKITYAKEKK